MIRRSASVTSVPLKPAQTMSAKKSMLSGPYNQVGSGHELFHKVPILVEPIIISHASVRQADSIRRQSMPYCFRSFHAEPNEWEGGWKTPIGSASQIQDACCRPQTRGTQVPPP